MKNQVIPPDPRTNDFESVQSTLIWKMENWPGGRLDRLRDNANYTCQSTGNTVGGGVRSTTFFGVECAYWRLRQIFSIVNRLIFSCVLSDPPENITVSSKIISVVEKQEPQEKVVCSAKAYPEPSYQWRKEGETDTIIKGNTFVLSYQVPRRDGGNYVCEAFNRHGSITETIYLNVMCKCGASRASSESRVRLLTEDPVLSVKPECGITQSEVNGKPVLICQAHANPTEVDFTWKIKNENETVEDFIENRGLQSHLTLESRIENFRTYLCFANNSIGMSIPCERDVTGTYDGLEAVNAQ